MGKGNAISIEEYQRLHLEHESGVCLRDLATKYNYRLATLFYGFKRLGLTVHKATNEQRKTNRVVENWFKQIDTEVKAYYFGLLMADGYINKRKLSNKSHRVCLKLHKEDSYLIQFFIDQVQPGAKMYKDGNSLGCQINSTQLVTDLEKHGLVERKTVAGEHFPMLDNSLMPHFVRGYFDGDGSISLGARNRSTIYICCANLGVLYGFQDYFDRQGIKTGLHSEHREHMGYRTMHTLHIRDRQKFYKLIYSFASIFMIRKKLQFDHVNTVLTRKNWKRRA